MPVVVYNNGKKYQRLSHVCRQIELKRYSCQIYISPMLTNVKKCFMVNNQYWWWNGCHRSVNCLQWNYYIYRMDELLLLLLWTFAFITGGFFNVSMVVFHDSYIRFNKCYCGLKYKNSCFSDILIAVKLFFLTNTFCDL